MQDSWKSLMHSLYVLILITLIWRVFFLLLFVFGLPLCLSIWLLLCSPSYNSAAEIEEFENSRTIAETYLTTLFEAFSNRVVTFLFWTRQKLSCQTWLSFRNSCLKVDVLYILSNVFFQKMPNFTLKVPKILPQIFGW